MALGDFRVRRCTESAGVPQSSHPLCHYWERQKYTIKSGRFGELLTTDS